MGEEGVQELRDFVNDGGTLVAFNNASHVRHQPVQTAGDQRAGGRFGGAVLLLRLRC